MFAGRSTYFKYVKTFSIGMKLKFSEYIMVYLSIIYI